MRLFRDKKGNVRVIEALLASLLLLSSLTLIPMAQKRQDNQVETLSSTAMQTLLSLNSDGQLSSLVDEANWAALRCLIQSCISPTLWFNLTVFDENMVCLNPTPICSGSLISQNTASVDFAIAGISGNFHVYIMRLQVGRLT